MASTKNIQVLVVDDETFVLNLSVRLLKKLGYENVHTASDGSLGLSFIKEHTEPVDLILCDLNMPGMDGIEFMRRLSDNGYEGSLILLSGENRRMLDTAMDLASAHKLNVLGSLPKPLNPVALEPLLSQLTLPGKPQLYKPVEAISVEELQSGITDDAPELALFYQPKVHIRTGEIRSVEALARWRHRDRGLLGPGAFIGVAEESGLIDLLTFAIYRRAVQQISDWLMAGVSLQVSVNFSINTFSRDDLSRFLIDITQEFGVSPEQVMLEVTESQVMQNATSCQEIMMRLRLRKFGLSIDDFGTGHSSLVQLKQIPFTELKIDRAFVRGAAANSSARAILEASARLAQNLEMQTVAEGAETREDWDLVESLGVDYLQGYYCAKPMSGDDLVSFLKKWTGPHRVL